VRPPGGSGGGAVAPVSALHAAPRASGGGGGGGGGSGGGATSGGGAGSSGGGGAMGAAEDDAKPLLGHGPRGGVALHLHRLQHSGTGRAVLAAGVSVTWMCFSSLLILLNKHILKDLNFGCAAGWGPGWEAVGAAAWGGALGSARCFRSAARAGRPQRPSSRWAGRRQPTRAGRAVPTRRCPATPPSPLPPTSYPMTVSSMGMFASGLLSFVMCKVLNLAEANTHVSRGARGGGEEAAAGRRGRRFRGSRGGGGGGRERTARTVRRTVLALDAHPCARFNPPPPQITLHYYCTHMLPVGFFMALTLWAGNLVYLYLTVSFIQMLKVRDGLGGR
jgi:hypothetical protein